MQKRRACDDACFLVVHAIALMYLNSELACKHGGAENARLENAELENAAPNCRTGIKTRERTGYGKPLDPKQRTHFPMSL